MADAIGGPTASPILVTGAIGFVTILGIYLYLQGNKPTEKLTSRAVSTTAKTSKAKKSKKNKSTATTTAPPPAPVVPEPAPLEEQQLPPPEPVVSAKNKKKKKKKDGIVEPAVAPVTTEVKKEPIPDPEPVSKSKKKREKKKAAAAVFTKSKPARVADNVDDDDDSDDDMVEQAARLLSMKKKSNGKVVKQTSNATNGVATPAASATKAKAGKGAESSVEQVPAEVVLDIGADAALLIGPGGSTIQGISKESGAKLDILKNTPEFGLNRVRITASAEGNEDVSASISKAVEMVQALLDERAAIIANSKTVNLSSSDINGQAGVKAIIGRKGETIQSILKQVNGEANGSAAPGQIVKINADVEAGTVEISGPKNLVDRAVKLCKQAVFGESQASLKLTSRSAMNIVFGKDFRTIQQLQSASGAKLDMDKETLTLNISGKKEEVDAAKKAVTSMLDRCRGITMDVKSSDVGAVYGKGGSIIRNIQDKTGAFIEVQQQPSSLAPDGESMVKCTIMGEPDACAQAVILINKAMAREVELKPGEVVETLSLGGAATPAVIGKGGAKIKELEAAHKVSLNVNGDVCKMIGKEANIKAVKEAIHAIIDPILAVEAAEKEATKAAESGDSAWQAFDVPPEEDGW
ncbi:KH domain containing protein [Nitzschia inconspicua]|uniref:KH domain containing protein n=1 Tax=Nitzschia inconspicua TaxID=303405 RepID=A0A9K3KRM6_9STRA|nr:KH domain containing protein [Nitzschia inconspicua]